MYTMFFAVAFSIAAYAYKRYNIGRKDRFKPHTAQSCTSALKTPQTMQASVLCAP